MVRWKRWAAALTVLLAIPALSTATTITAAGAATAVTAADHSARGPFAIEDQFGSQYVFWKNHSGHIGEAVYNVYTRKWIGPSQLPVGAIASEPTAAPSPDQEFARSGNRLFSWLYVYWASSSTNLMMAYYNGSSWKGPFKIPIGVAGVSTPTAADSVINGHQQMDIYWREADGHLWQTHSSSNPANPKGYSKAVEATHDGKSLGTLGSAPAASAASCLPIVCTATVVWRGGDNELWLATYNLDLHTWSAPRHYQVGNPPHGYTGKIGSPPSIVMDTQFSGYPFIVWQGTGSSRSLELIRAKSPSVLNVGFGPLGSAPTIAWSAATDNPPVSDQLFVYWTSFSGYLVEAHDEASGWHRSVLTQLGKIA
jgi:hypothetical protein